MYLSEQERDRRYGLVRRTMNERGADALLVVGNNHASGSPFFSQEVSVTLLTFLSFPCMAFCFSEPSPLLPS
jgi:hypothetical protein